MQKRAVPMDFFSWHVYGKTPARMMEKAELFKSLMQTYGYGHAESILNEWNYVRGWGDGDFKYTVLAIHGIKGAAFTMACISEAQRTDFIDMLMYYDTRPSVFCGAFDYYSYDTLKGYYPLYWYGQFYDMQAYVPCQSAAEDLYTLCGVDQDGKLLCALTYYTEDDDAAPKEVALDFGREGNFEVYLLDETHDAELVATTASPTFTMNRHSCILLREI
jgi:hypothetical protein